MYPIKSNSSGSHSRLVLAVRGCGAAVAVTVLLAGCGGSSGSGVAQVSSGTTSASRSSAQPTSGRASPVAFAACMRSRGVPNFPDPGSNGRSDLSGVDPGSPQFQAATSACKSLLPGGRAGYSTQGGSTISPQQQTQLLRYARCMRSHGVPNFPDPTGRGLSLGQGIDPRSPQFQSAMQACHQLLPGLGQGSVHTVGAGGVGGS